MIKTLLAAIALTLTGPALAELCKYEDAQGHITYSDTAVKGARKLGCLGAPPPPVAVPVKPSADVAKQPAVSGGRADSALARREALQARLAEEEQKLRVAREELAHQESIRSGDERNYQRVLDRLKPYQEAVQQAERAVEAARAELGERN